MSELENMIEMLIDELDGFRKRANPNDNIHHKYHRMFLTLAQAVQKLTEATDLSGEHKTAKPQASPSPKQEKEEDND